MTAAPHPSHPAPRAEAGELALRLAHAENMLRTLTSGQVDAIVSPDGNIFLLHPAQTAPPKDR